MSWRSSPRSARSAFIRRQNYGSRSYDLNADTFRILDVKSGIDVLFRIYLALLELLCYRVAVEAFDSNRKVIHDAHGRFMMERNESFVRCAEANNFVRLVFAHLV